MSNTVTTEKNTSKKAKALLAGGLVLGVGAVVTLASWTDQEWASASFQSGSFTIESDAHDGKGFDSRSDIDGSTLNFEMPRTGKLGPNEKVAAPLSLRLDKDTTHDATVTMTADADRHIEGLSYEAIPVKSPEDCSIDTESNGAQNKLGSAPAASPEIKLSANGANTPGDASTLCFVVSADGNLAQDQTATASWTFVGESVTADS